MKPCIPRELQQQAEAAARRKEAALDNMISVASAAPVTDVDDAFERSMRGLIDADKAAVQAIEQKRKRS